MTQDRGTFRAYKERNFNNSTLRLITIANSIIEEYEGQGLTMTLRQLYYQFVARDVLPNSGSSYNQLKGAVSEGRMAGLVSWTAIEDRTRNLMGLRTYSSPAAAFRAARAAFRLDLWADQQWRPEVWVEKEAPGRRRRRHLQRPPRRLLRRARLQLAERAVEGGEEVRRLRQQGSAADRLPPGRPRP
jgi:hypothetical protein